MALPSIKDLFKSNLDKVIDSTGNAIDKLSTTKEEKLSFKNNLSQILADYSAYTYNTTLTALHNETKGNWLQRSWRPILMLAFGAIIITSCFTPLQLNYVPEEFWNLLKIGIGGYVGGRTLEKVTDSISKNMDFSIYRKKR